MFFLYQIAIFLLKFSLRIWAVFNPKIQKWNSDRNVHTSLLLSNHFNPEKKPIVWMHCASLGEFEQGRPLLDRLFDMDKKNFYLLTFFSPSGYEIRKNYNKANVVIYLPIDQKSTIKEIIKKLQPSLFIGVKYDFWWNLLHELNSTSCKVIYIALKADPTKYYLKKGYSPFTNVLKKMDHIFTLDKESIGVLSNLKFSNHAFGGDPRIDSVIAHQSRMLDASKLPVHQRPVIVYGSIYVSDLPIIQSSILNNKDYCHVIVPHDVSLKNMEAISNELQIKPVMVSQPVPLSCDSIYMVHQIGHLMNWYASASLVYIGGAFEHGIHNTLEAAVFGIPLATGPDQKNFPEIHEFMKNGVLTQVENESDFLRFIAENKLKEKRDQVRSQALEFFKINAGATERIINAIQ